MDTAHTEVFGNTILKLGGKHGYERVRGGQGSNDLFQGYTKNKEHFTGLFETPHKAAVALAVLEQDLQLGLIEEKTKKRKQRRDTQQAPRCIFFAACHHRAHD